MKSKDCVQEIQRYLSSWFILIDHSNAISYFDINKISEGTSLHLLNLLYGYKLKDLNRISTNFAGIDLGDSEISMMAFQVTSRIDLEKIKKTLQTFHKNGYINEFSRGIKILMLSNTSIRRKKTDKFNAFKDFFDLGRDVIGIKELIQRASDLYYQAPDQFEKVRRFLENEFGTYSNHLSGGLNSFKNKTEKIKFYKDLFLKRYYSSVQYFVPLFPIINNDQIDLNILEDLILNKKDGILISGPSGCGKSCIARKLALNLLEQLVPVIIEAKYYEKNLNDLFNKEVTSYSFNSDADFLHTISVLKLQIVLIIDGLNECNDNLRSKFLLEIDKAIKDWNIKVILTTQVISSEFSQFDLHKVTIPLPTDEIKHEIVTAFSKIKEIPKLSPILRIISTNMEAKMMGEVWGQLGATNNRISLFESFLKVKLGEHYLDGCQLLTSLAMEMSDMISFSLPERNANKHLIQHKLPSKLLSHCLKSAIIELKSGKLSFGHEMLFIYFVADGITRFKIDHDEIIAAFNAPKNHDKRLLIIGTISDRILLNKILMDLKDADLFTTFSDGEAGEYCKQWIETEYQNILAKINFEIKGCKFEYSEDLGDFRIKEDTLLDWSDQEIALIASISNELAQGKFIPEILHLTGSMDHICQRDTEKFWELGKSKGLSARSRIFFHAYEDPFHKKSGLSILFKTTSINLFKIRSNQSLSVDYGQFISDKKLTPGQIYLFVLLLRFDVRLKALYPEALYIFQNWRFYPTTLITELLTQIRYLTDDKLKLLKLVDLIKCIREKTQNVWLSTLIFDKLNDLGALEEENDEFIVSAESEVKSVLSDPHNQINCEYAANIFFRQFDHPFYYAYQDVISNLSDSSKKTFYRMALIGESHLSLSTITLITRAYREIGELANLYVLKWIDTPFHEPVFPVDSLGVFLITHQLLAKYNSPILSHNLSEIISREVSLKAIGEIFYWMSRYGIKEEELKEAVEPISNVLFSKDNSFVIETIWEAFNAIYYYRYYEDVNLGIINTFEEYFKKEIAQSSRKAIIDYELQEGIWNHRTKKEDIRLHAISLLGKHGTLIDLELLMSLTENNIYGKEAIEAIKKINQ